MDIVKRLTVDDIYKIKLEHLRNVGLLKSTFEKIYIGLNPIHAYSGYYLDDRSNFKYQENSTEKNIDYYCWMYVVGLYHLEKYMLCTEYNKMMKEICNGKTPVFNPENAKMWLHGLRELIYENIKTMIESVFEKLMTKKYGTGNKIKKRNNNGIDKNFIITTRDYQSIHGYYSYSFGTNNPTVTDDLEKVCYILDGKNLPEITIKMKMKNNSTYDCRCVEMENAYFKIKTCKNGNTHYTINDDIRNKLNKLGADSSIIGENIRIKEFETWC